MFKTGMHSIILFAACLFLSMGSVAAAPVNQTADIAALQQEDKLIARMETAAAVLLDSDAQQMMWQAFGRKFVPAALADIPDKLLRDQLLALHRAGYTFLQGEGTYYLAVDYQALLNDYESGLGAEVRDYLRLQAAETTAKTFEDAGLAISRDLLGKRALAAEAFLRRYPDSYRRSQVSDLYFAYASAFLFGVDNTPVREKSGALKPEAAAAWRQVLREHDDAALADWVRELEAADQKPNEERTAAYKAVRAELVQAVFPSRQGVYSGVRGQATLLAPDGSLYFIDDRFGAAERADQITNGDDAGQPILMTVRGAVNRSLPDNGLASFYKQTIVVDQVSNVSHWSLDDPAMPFALVGVGVEPFWHVRILENGFVFLSELGEPVQLFASPIKETLPDGFRYSLKRFDGAALIVTAQWAAGGVSDGMSDNIYPCRVTMVFNGKTMKGSGFTQTEKVRRDI